jgi:hypothetical protein
MPYALPVPSFSTILGIGLDETSATDNPFSGVGGHLDSAATGVLGTTGITSALAAARRRGDRP